jgi:plastocyanin
VKRLVVLGWLIALVAIGAACSKSETPPVSTTPPPAAAPAGVASANGTVTGMGPAPDAAGAVVVVLEPKGARAFPPQSETPVMDQAGLTFGPELLLVRTGHPVEFRNSDDTLHNVRVSHEETRTSSFNVAIPTGESYTYTFERDGFYRVGCDIHPAMAASIFAASTPYTTLADGSGAFSFADVPAGSWTVTIYAGGRKLRKDVEVSGGLTSVTIE